MLPRRMNVRVTLEKTPKPQSKKNWKILEWATLLISAAALFVAIKAWDEGANEQNQTTAIKRLQDEISQLRQISATDSLTQIYIRGQLEILRSGYFKAKRDSAEHYKNDSTEIHAIDMATNQIYLDFRIIPIEIDPNWMKQIDDFIDREKAIVKTALSENTYVFHNPNISKCFNEYFNFMMDLKQQTPSPNPGTYKQIFRLFKYATGCFHAYLEAADRNTRVRSKQFLDEIGHANENAPNL